MADLAKLVVKLEAQTTEFQNRLASAERMFKKTNKNLSVIASNAAIELAAKFAQAAGAFIRVGKAAIDAADDMNDMAKRTGLSTETLSRLDYAAQQSGTSFETLSKSLGKFAKVQADAALGGKASAEAFERVGIAIKNADGSLRATDAVLLDIADKFAGLEDGAAKAALAQELFGKSGAELIPFLNQGREGIEELTKEADKLGVTISGETAQAADNFNDSLNKMRNAGKGVVNQLINEVMPTLAYLTEDFLSTAESTGLLDFAVAALSVTFKSFLTAGIIVKSVLQQLGRIIYGVAASLVRVAQFEFRLAAAEMKDAFAGASDNVSKDMERIATIWKGTGATARDAAKEQNAAIKQSLLFNPEKAADETGKAAAAALESLQSIATGLRDQVATYGMAEAALIRYRLAHGDLADEVAVAGPNAQQYVEQIIRMTEEMERLNAETTASAEKQRVWDEAVAEGVRITEQMKTPVELYGDSIQRLNELLAAGHITQETYNRAVEAAQDTLDKAAEEQNTFLEQANRNVQDILGKGINDVLDKGFKEGAKSALDAFTDMLRQMAIQALAAQIAKKIFGGEGMGSGGGWASALGSLFGGSRDSGGRGRAGMAYMIGTGAQPEMFIPDSAGEFVPAGAMAGGGRITQNIYVQGRVDQRSARQLELEAARRQNTARSRLG